ncbi:MULTISPECIES: DUF5302 domain-containing protein [Kineosporia]|uniref:DUF5302 domain-containing protein n=1 Tax=Kineosporia mesophila TaxID=566012 RepID=A0ABP7AI40_9ACTN|nr:MULTISPECIES: DUF5302 domain-containing protein [Kineosporia]MCD5350733.1 DUF5302 domain-containing protein [Kineosporia mesophila]GLY33591.1 hypothetical protein Kisp02_69560 [Kineosporia sp. NBRC 101731]
MTDDKQVSSDTKRKFREALERKNANGGQHQGEVQGNGKVGGSHGPETSGSQQMFRRKSS